MKTFVILAMHGTPPNDFPKEEMAEMFVAHARLEHASGKEREAIERRYTEIERKMRAWPRTLQNDPFYVASQDLAALLRQKTEYEVIVGFNEFCGPSVGEAIDLAAKAGAEKIIVATTMMTRGGEHAETDLPAMVKLAQVRHTKIPIKYAWPFEDADVARFLASQIAKFL